MFQGSLQSESRYNAVMTGETELNGCVLPSIHMDALCKPQDKWVLPAPHRICCTVPLKTPFSCRDTMFNHWDVLTEIKTNPHLLGRVSSEGGVYGQCKEQVTFLKGRQYLQPVTQNQQHQVGVSQSVMSTVHWTSDNDWGMKNTELRWRESHSSKAKRGMWWFRYLRAA